MMIIIFLLNLLNIFRIKSKSRNWKISYTSISFEQNEHFPLLKNCEKFVGTTLNSEIN